MAIDTVIMFFTEAKGVFCLIVRKKIWNPSTVIGSAPFSIPSIGVPGFCMLDSAIEPIPSPTDTIDAAIVTSGEIVSTSGFSSTKEKDNVFRADATISFNVPVDCVHSPVLMSNVDESTAKAALSAVAEPTKFVIVMFEFWSRS